MSEGGRGEGNEGAPRVDETATRSEGGGETAPRRVGDVRGEREAQREAERSRREAELGTSWVSVVLGWLAALGASLILSGIVGAIVGAIFAVLGASGGTQAGGISGLVGLVLTLLIAFFLGGYVAGRMASRQGVKHGILVPVLALVVTVVLALAGGALGVSFVDQLSGITLPGPLNSVAQNATQQGLGTILTVSGVLALLATFLGGALGGARGAKVGEQRP